MQVVMQTNCVARVGGVAIPLVSGKEYDLADEVANNLLSAGYASAKRKSAATRTQTDEPERTGSDSEEQSKPVQKRSSRSKRLDGAPENKAEDVDG